jgi:hypothetical protein
MIFVKSAGSIFRKESRPSPFLSHNQHFPVDRTGKRVYNEQFRIRSGFSLFDNLSQRKGFAMGTLKLVLGVVYIVMICLLLVSGFKISRSICRLFETDRAKLTATATLCRSIGYTGFMLALIAAFNHDAPFVALALQFTFVGMMFGAPEVSDSDTKPETTTPPPQAGN